MRRARIGRKKPWETRIFFAFFFNGARHVAHGRPVPLELWFDYIILLLNLAASCIPFTEKKLSTFLGSFSLFARGKSISSDKEKKWALDWRHQWHVHVQWVLFEVGVSSRCGCRNVLFRQKRIKGFILFFFCRRWGGGRVNYRRGT